MAILEETFRYLAENVQVAQASIHTLVLGHYFTVVELHDGGVGACMSYYRLPPPALDVVERQLAALLLEDPLLLKCLFGRKRMGLDLESDANEQFLLQATLRTTVLSALSATFLSSGGDATFVASGSWPFDPFAGTRSALVIGFGGYMDHLARAPQVEVLHIADLSYPQRRDEMDALAERYRKECPWKAITVSDGHDTPERLRDVDVVSITASALCNGTLEELLEQARGSPRVVVQGQSGSIHPRALFKRGVNLVATTLKPRELVKRAQADRTGKHLKPVLEGGLPWLYLAPKNPDGAVVIPRSIGDTDTTTPSRGQDVAGTGAVATEGISAVYAPPVEPAD